MLRQKMLQDMKANKWQFLSILLMAFLGVYIFTGVGGELVDFEALSPGSKGPGQPRSYCLPVWAEREHHLYA